MNQRSWLNPLLLALFPAIIIIWLQPIKFSPLLFELSYVRDNSTVWFEDLENDGKAEQIIYQNEHSEGHASVLYYNDKKQYIGQYNFKHPIAKVRDKQKPYSADFNNDGVKDIVFFTQNKDSLFLNTFDYQNEDALVNNRFITKIGGFNQHLDYNINYVGHYDVNHDSVPEFYFSVSGGFSHYPRRIFRYDIANDSLIASVNTGAGHLPGQIFEYNNSEIIAVGSAAYGNIRENYPYPYHDSTTWFFCFDKNLKLKFPPKNYGINPSGISLPIQINEYIYYLFASNNAKQENKLFKMNWQGEVTDSIVFDFYVSKKFVPIKIKNKIRYFIYNEDTREYFHFDDINFKIQAAKQLYFARRNRIFSDKDLNNNGQTDYVTFNHLTKQMVIYDQQFRKQNELINDKYIKFVSFNYFNKLGYGELTVNANDQTKIFRYYNNPNRHLKYPLWFFIYFISILFVGLIQYSQNRRILRQQKMEQQLADLQLQNLRNQLDPHFTFNVLNSVGNAIYKQDKEGAYDLFQRFTRIIRSSLMSSDKVFRTLKEELQFTQDYLEFQKIRFKERFNYSFEIDKNIEAQNVKFPKMLVQGFAENAVKHAFYGVDYTGQITIKVFEENNSLKVIIEDDGIGIEQSKKQKATSGTQKGLKVLEEQVKQINQIYGSSYSVLIKDQSEFGTKKHGTHVIISLKAT